MEIGTIIMILFKKIKIKTFIAASILLKVEKI